MKLQQIKCKHLNRTQDIFVSPSYIIACTGRRAIILNRQYQLLHTIEKLDYVYDGEVSPDEKKLLLVSTGNKFYVVDLETYEMERVTVRSPYNEGIEGRGCWSFDGKSIFILAMSSKTMNSVLRQYFVDNLKEYKEYFPDEFYLNDLQKMYCYNKYMLIRYNRKNKKNYFITFDGKSMEEILIEKSKNMSIFRSDFDEVTGNFTICSGECCWKYTPEGKMIEKIEHPSPKTKKISFSDTFNGIFGEGSDEAKMMKKVSFALGLEDIECEDHINKYGTSKCGKYDFFATGSGFYVVDSQTKEVLAEVLVDNGFDNFEQLESDVVAVASPYNGVKLYRILEG